MPYDFVNKPKHYNGHKLLIVKPDGTKEIVEYETINLIDSLAERLEEIGVPAAVIYKILTGLKYYDRLAGGKPDGDKSVFEKLAEDLRKIGWYVVHAADQLDENKDLEKAKENNVSKHVVKKIYISGAISGDKYWIKKFKAAELKLKEIYPEASILSPLVTEHYAEDDNWSYEDFMHIDFAMIDICDTIYFLNDWIKSPGALREFEYVKDKEWIMKVFE